MRSMGTRRVALFAGAATVAAVALSGCSAGHYAETANKEPSVYGVNLENADKSVALRGVAVSYNNTKGYPAGGTAPLELALFNRTTRPVTVRIASQPLADADATRGVVFSRSVSLVGTAPTPVASTIDGAVEPTGSREAARPVGPPAADQPGVASNAPTAEPSATVQPGAAAGPAEITIAPLDSAIFRPQDAQQLQLIGLSGPLLPGNSVNLVFTFSNGAEPLTMQAPVGVPTSPAPRGSAENEGVGEGQEQTEGH